MKLSRLRRLGGITAAEIVFAFGALEDMGVGVEEGEEVGDRSLSDFPEMASASIR